MEKYILLAVIFNFIVDFLLLLGTNRLSGCMGQIPRAVLGAALGAVMTAASFLPGLGFLKNFLWRLVSLALMASVAFGWNAGSLQKGFLFVLLNMALGGMTHGLAGNLFWSAAGAAVMLGILCLFGFQGKIGGRSIIPVELSYGSSRVQIQALQDTGNTLYDPITGRPVLVIGAETATQLTGLTAEQLRRPVESVGALPGLRLVPYRTVGQSHGLLLALRFHNVKIGTYRGSSLVAFAPENLDAQGAYQALTGGTV